MLLLHVISLATRQDPQWLQTATHAAHTLIGLRDSRHIVHGLSLIYVQHISYREAADPFRGVVGRAPPLLRYAKIQLQSNTVWRF